MRPSSPSSRDSKRRLILVLSLLGLFLGLVYRLSGTACLFEAFFGIPCPGCGLTRATLAFLALDFPKAFQMHPLFLLAYADIAVILTLAVTGKQNKAANIFLLFSLVSFLGLYAYRMMTMYPAFSPMQPNPRSIIAQLYHWLIRIDRS